MNKKQATRKLGSIETKQVKQPKQPAQPKQPIQPKQLKQEIPIESEHDDNIEASSFSEVEPEVEPEVKPRKKRVITEEQKKILVERLAYARSMRKQSSENKKVLQQDYLKQKEEELNERLIKKITSLQRKKETEMMNKYLTQDNNSACGRGVRGAEPPEDDESEVEEVIIKKKRAVPKKKIVYQYEDDDADEAIYVPPPAPSLHFC